MKSWRQVLELWAKMSANGQGNFHFDQTWNILDSVMVWTFLICICKEPKRQHSLSTGGHSPRSSSSSIITSLITNIINIIIIPHSIYCDHMRHKGGGGGERTPCSNP
jgi:hypothetical protein